MDRLERMGGVTKEAATPAGVLIGGISLGIEYFNTEMTLILLSVVISSGVLIVLYSVGQDVKDQNKKILSRTAEIHALEVEEPDSDDSARPDGGPWLHMRGLKVDEDEISSIPSVAGAAAGAALGTPWGPVGAAIGGLIGAIAGSSLEYSNLQDRHQKQLQRVARQAAERKAGLQGGVGELLEVEDDSDKDAEYWIFEFEGDGPKIHRVRINKETGDVYYQSARGGSNPLS